jgi:hypothetical protein
MNPVVGRDVSIDRTLTVYGSHPMIEADRAASFGFPWMTEFPNFRREQYHIALGTLFQEIVV